MTQRTLQFIHHVFNGFHFEFSIITVFCVDINYERTSLQHKTYHKISSRTSCVCKCREIIQMCRPNYLIHDQLLVDAQTLQGHPHVILISIRILRFHDIQLEETILCDFAILKFKSLWNIDTDFTPRESITCNTHYTCTYVVIEFNLVNVHNYNKFTHVHALPRILNHINNKKAKSPFPVHVLLYNVIIKHNNNENNHFFQKEAKKKEISHVPSTTSHSSSPTSSSLVRMLYQLNSSRLIVPFPSRSDRSKTSSSTFL